MGGTNPTEGGAGGWKGSIRIACGPEPDRNQIIDVVDSAMASEAEFLLSEGFSGSLEEQLSEFSVTITENESRYYIDLSPKSGEGHDGSFAIDKATGALDRGSLAVGEVLPEPEDEADWE